MRIHHLNTNLPSITTSRMWMLTNLVTIHKIVLGITQIEHGIHYGSNIGHIRLNSQGLIQMDGPGLDLASDEERNELLDLAVPIVAAYRW